MSDTDGVASITAKLTNPSDEERCYWEQPSGSALGFDITALDGRRFFISQQEVVIVPEQQQFSSGPMRLKMLQPLDSIVLSAQLQEPIGGVFQNENGGTYQSYQTGDALVFNTSVFVSDCQSNTIAGDTSLTLVTATEKIRFRF